MEQQEQIKRHNFRLKEIEIINGGTEFKANWTEKHETDALDYDTKHMKQDYNFNNYKPAYLASKLQEHAVELNSHTEDTVVNITKIGINEYGIDGEKQFTIKLDYEFYASGENPAKATTNKVVMSEDYYHRAEDVIKIIEDMIENMYDHLVEGTRFPIEEADAELEGNILQVA